MHDSTPTTTTSAPLRFSGPPRRAPPLPRHGGSQVRTQLIFLARLYFWPSVHRPPTLPPALLRHCEARPRHGADEEKEEEKVLFTRAGAALTAFWAGAKRPP